MNKIEGLLNWCKYHTAGYENVSIKNFTTSWKNGLAFSALIHRFKPELIDFHRLDPQNEYHNNYTAFKLADTHFGIPPLLDPEDMVLSSCPERLSIITYVSQFYNCLKEMEPMGGPEVNKFEANCDTELESMTSLCKLGNMKCFICRDKVYLLERYVAEDKLYHRKCYRYFQIKNIDYECDVIEDYLNIYGQLKPTMNTAIFVHPVFGINSDGQTNPLITNPPINIAEEILSDNDQFECHSESLSKSLSESLSSFSSNASEQSNKSHDLTKEGCSNKSVYVADITVKNDSTCCQENLVLNISKGASLKPIKSRLYIKKKDKELPYSTFFEISSSMNAKNYFNISGNERANISDEISLINEVDNTNIRNKILDDNRNVGYSSMEKDTRKLISINLDDEMESDLSSVEEGNSEVIQASIVRNSIWRKPIICSTSIRKYQSASVPFETEYKYYSDFKDRLGDLNSKQSKIEAKGRNIQHRLWEEDPNTQEYENLLIMWLELVEEKDRIFYEENALYSWLKDLKLQEMKESIEYQIRLLSNDVNRDENANKIEGDLIKKLIETVNKRSELVDAMHQENVKRLQSIKLRQEALEKIGPSQDKKDKIISTIQNETTKKKIKFWKKKSF